MYRKLRVGNDTVLVDSPNKHGSLVNYRSCLTRAYNHTKVRLVIGNMIPDRYTVSGINAFVPSHYNTYLSDISGNNISEHKISLIYLIIQGIYTCQNDSYCILCNGY